MRPSTSGESAHPRSRGENEFLITLNGPPDGSSPLTRGKRRKMGYGDAAWRLIPAHAGKTTATRGCVAPLTAHPRSRGENSTASSTACMLIGSSPLTRGKLGQRQLGNGVPGLIPAHAGKTDFADLVHQLTQAHPRSRGENKMQARDLTLDTGSSPLTRGKQDAGA